MSASDLQIINHANILLSHASPMMAGDERSVTDWASQLSTVPDSSKLAARLHLLSLLFEVSLV